MTAFRITLLLAASLVLSAQSWTEDQGEAGTAEDEYALGVDVQAKLGQPSGPTLSGDALDDATAEVASRLRCPSCQGLSINDSPAETARNMKRQVRAMLAAGYDAEQINVYFESAYGEFVLMAPKVEGLNLLVWGAPVVLVVGGLLLVFGVVGKPREGTAEAPAPPPETDDPYLKRIREEVEGA
ncbi:MAG: hypothetical protein GY898_07060 [Proteobacteria bacterium]|nr:hypothetical protein [Pseudomonadota bacterium]